MDPSLCWTRVEIFNRAMKNSQDCDEKTMLAFPAVYRRISSAARTNVRQPQESSQRWNGQWLLQKCMNFHGIHSLHIAVETFDPTNARRRFYTVCKKTKWYFWKTSVYPRTIAKSWSYRLWTNLANQNPAMNWNAFRPLWRLSLNAMHSENSLPPLIHHFWNDSRAPQFSNLAAVPHWSGPSILTQVPVNFCVLPKLGRRKLFQSFFCLFWSTVLSFNFFCSSVIKQILSLDGSFCLIRSAPSDFTDAGAIHWLLCLLLQNVQLLLPANKANARAELLLLPNVSNAPPAIECRTENPETFPRKSNSLQCKTDPSLFLLRLVNSAFDYGRINRRPQGWSRRESQTRVPTEWLHR